MKRAGVDCGTSNDCSNPNPLALCECDTQGNCSHQLLGDLGIMEKFNSLSAAGFHLAMEASTTKFHGKEDKEGNMVLECVGLLAEAGLQKGDVLHFVVTKGEPKNNSYSIRCNREHILGWQFTEPELVVIYKRDGQVKLGTMKNPTTG